MFDRLIIVCPRAIDQTTSAACVANQSTDNNEAASNNHLLVLTTLYMLATKINPYSSGPTLS